MVTTTKRLVGRDEELAALVQMLSAREELPAALVLEGEAGIGKTAVWQQGVKVGEELSYRVLTSRPALPEMQISFAGLRDLLDGFANELLPELAVPQRRALEVALLRREPGESRPDQGVVAAALLAGVRMLASGGPVLIALDDVQWLDEPTAFVLTFALRRLQQEQVAVLITTRMNGPDSASVLVGALAELLTRRIVLGGLSVGALHHLVHTRLGLTLARPMLQRLHETSGGNPFFALELARALQQREHGLAAGERLPVSGRLQELLDERLAALPPGVEDVLLVAAALSQPTLDLVERADVADARQRLDPAVESELIELDGKQIRFAHPLIASAVYSRASAERKRAVHRSLAGLVADPEERAFHLALATDKPDADVAAALAHAAEAARRRGAPQAAADLGDHALRLTPPEDVEAAHRRRLDAGAAYLEAGDTTRARQRFEEAAAVAAAGRRLAEALSRLARVHVFEGDRRQSAELCRRALTEVGDDLELRSEIEEGLAVSYYFLRENLSSAAAHARSAVEAARAVGESRALAEALAAQGLVDGLLGRASARTAFEEAVNLEQATTSLRVLRQPRYSESVYVMWSDDLLSARARFEALYGRALDRGDESSLPLILAHLSGIECTLGDWVSAHDRATTAYDVALQTVQLPHQAYALGARALVNAHLGRVEETRADAGEALRLTSVEPNSYGSASASAALALLELSLDDPAATHAALGLLVGRYEVEGVIEPGAQRFLADEIEALIGLGRSEEAARALARLEERAQRLERRSALAACARCRGLLAASGGDLEAALASFRDALTLNELLEMPFERARALLGLGATERRAKERRAARQTLEAALELFERLGAGLWAAQARTELQRIGGRAPARGELTAAEWRVAELVAQGRTNREVAAALFLTPRTVEGTLSRVYAKLGVRSRAELAHRWASRET